MKSNTARASAVETSSVAQPAPVAPSTEAKTPAVKTNRKVVGGPALDRLIALGASLIPLPSKGKLHTTVTSQLGSAVLASELAARVNPMVKSWSQFDRGYLVGPSASYSACAVTTGSKKAKSQPAFVFAGRSGDTVTLYTADGAVWERPAKGEREQGVYDAALGQAVVALPA